MHIHSSSLRVNKYLLTICLLIFIKRNFDIMHFLIRLQCPGVEVLYMLSKVHIILDSFQTKCLRYGF